MTERVKIKCDDCKFVEECVDYGWDGCRKFTPTPSEPMTNEEYLKSCNTEQLAEYLANTFDLCGAGCHNCFLANVCLTKAKNGNCLTQEQIIFEWLKQLHQGE
jgi:hypothetical protein